MNVLLIKEIVKWWQQRDYLEIYNVRETTRGLKFTVDIDGAQYVVSVKEVQ